ncbi:hypothetical protein C0993_010646 [Termitomyces sp. T159_Od127]|nr:hypothetical protein C0993_010646 [Termitomyces sp. T159_Od127]
MGLVLQTKFMNEEGVASVTDFLPRPSSSSSPAKPLLPWLIRRVECIRGTMPLMMQCAPAFNYARDAHSTEIVPDNSIPPVFPTSASEAEARLQEPHKKAVFTSSAGFVLDLRYIPENTLEAACVPSVELGTLDLTSKGHKGFAAYSALQLCEGQAVTFVLRTPPEHETTPVTAGNGVNGAQKAELERVLIGPLGVKVRTTNDPYLTKELLHSLLTITNRYWYEWIRQSTYTGSWKEAVHRSALALKLLIYEPTGTCGSRLSPVCFDVRSSKVPSSPARRSPSPSSLAERATAPPGSATPRSPSTPSSVSDSHKKQMVRP